MHSPIRARAQAAMTATPREQFLPPDQVQWADQDRPLPIMDGQTNSQPTTVLDMLELLDARPGQRVLDLGSGSGWTTAILARLVGPPGQVIGVERHESLVRFGQQRLGATGMPWARIDLARAGTLGLPEQGPFDRILVSAEARDLDPALTEQLAAAGILVAPIAGRLTRVTMSPGGPRTKRYGRYNFVPLVR